MTMNTASLVLSALAIVVAAGSLAFSVYTDDKKMECEFRYKTYDRLNQLASVVHENIVRTRDRLDQAKRAASPEVAAASPEEATELLNAYLLHYVDDVAVASRKLQLHRFSIPEEVFTELNGKVDEIQDLYPLLDATRKESRATENDLLAYAAKAESFWERMRMVIDSTLADTAMAIRRRCQ